MPASIRLKPNDILRNRYKIMRNYRAGGMGCIDIGWDMENKQYVVVKYASIEGKPDVDRLKNDKVRLESEVLRACDHPHIVKFVDDFSYSGANFLIIAYIDGVSLSDLVAVGALPEHQVLQITKEILLAISHLHQKNIIYRDLKPSNVQVRKSDGHVVLLDFGTAKMVSGDIKTPSGEGTVIYTPGYEAPEQLSGRADFRSDICAVGLTMYYMTTAKNPPHQRPVPMVTQENPRISRWIAEVICKATENSPENRYQDAMEMFWAIEQKVPIPSIARAVPTTTPPIGSPRLILKRVSAVGFAHYTEEKIYPMTKRTIILGREMPQGSPPELQPDITVNDIHVSIHPKKPGMPYGHARISLDEQGSFWIEDLGSSNGTYVNGSRINTSYQLKNGDQITLGYYTMFEFRID